MRGNCTHAKPGGSKAGVSRRVRAVGWAERLGVDATLHTRGADEASWERDASGRDIPFTHFTNDVDTSSCSAGALCGNLVESSISSLAAHFFCICCCLVSSEEGVGQDRVRADAAEMRNHVRMGLVKVEQMLDKV